MGMLPNSAAVGYLLVAAVSIVLYQQRPFESGFSEIVPIESAVLGAVPVVNLLADDAATTMDSGLRQFGFFYLKNHGVSQELIDEQFRQSHALFALPEDIKRSMAFVPHLDIGYQGSGDQALDESSKFKDTKEGYLMTNNAVMQADFELDPADPLQGSTLHLPPVTLLPKYEATLRKYAAAMTSTNHKLNKLLFQALGLSEKDRLQIAKQPFTVVKQLRYQPDGAGGTNASERLGAGAHTDWGSFTILATDQTPGLQVELDGEWINVPPLEGCLIVNAGDQINFWTSGMYKSGNHRVQTISSKPRYSTAFFTYFDYHAMVVPILAGEGVKTKDYFAFKLCQSMHLGKEYCDLPGT